MLRRRGSAITPMSVAGFVQWGFVHQNDDRKKVAPVDWNAKVCYGEAGLLLEGLDFAKRAARKYAEIVVRMSGDAFTLPSTTKWRTACVMQKAKKEPELRRKIGFQRARNFKAI